MKVSGKRWVLLLLPVSVIVLSLVYSIVMIAFFREPVIVDVIEVDPVSWSLERPSELVYSFEPIETLYNTDSASLQFSLFLLKYTENTWWEKDSFVFAVNATGSIDGGFVYSAAVNFSLQDGGSSFLNIAEDLDVWGEKYLQNFVLQEIVDYPSPVSYVKVRGIGESYSNMRAQGDWIFLDQHEVDHQLRMVLDAVWFNGTAYLRTILPIELEVTVA